MYWQAESHMKCWNEEWYQFGPQCLHWQPRWDNLTAPLYTSCGDVRQVFSFFLILDFKKITRLGERERKGKTKKEKETLLSAGSSLGGHTYQSRAKWEPGASFISSTWWQEPTQVGWFMLLFPRNYQGAGEEIEHLEHESVPTRDVSVAGSGFIGTNCSVSIHFGMNQWLEKFFLSLFLVLSHSSFQIINLCLKNV